MKSRNFFAEGRPNDFNAHFPAPKETIMIADNVGAIDDGTGAGALDDGTGAGALAITIFVNRTMTNYQSRYRPRNFNG